jgi:diaminopimelate decarboxylase
MAALKAGIKPSKIVFSGVGKTEKELYFAIKKNILLINKQTFDHVL